MTEATKHAHILDLPYILVSDEQQTDRYAYTYTHSFQILFPCRLLQNIE